jgi:two-component system response regulator MprA
METYAYRNGKKLEIHTMPLILVVDDDRKLLDMLHRTLAYEGYEVLAATNGREALDQVEARRPDVIVLDWLLPKLKGVEVVRRLRAAGDQVPILMLTAKDTIEDRVEGLDSGADDYLVKPFAPAELLARLRVILRRINGTSPDRMIRYADLSLDPVTRETRRGTRAFDLTPKEFDLLQILLRHPRQVLNRERILEEVWGYDFGGEENVLEVYIGYLRRKIEAGREPRLIHNVRGIGYVLREE